MSDTSGEPSRLTQPLAVVLLVVAGALALLAVVLVGFALASTTATGTFNLTPAAAQRALATVNDLPPGTSVVPTGDEGLTVNVVVTPTPQAEVPWWLRVVAALGTAVWAAGLATVAYLFARILANIAHGDPFHPGNARRFTLIAVAILVASVGADTINLLAAMAMSDHLGGPRSLQVSAYYSLIPIGIAALTLVLAGAFRAGGRMREDLEGLV